jgi:hypothetical protein
MSRFRREQTGKEEVGANALGIIIPIIEPGGGSAAREEALEATAGCQRLSSIQSDSTIYFF